MLRSVEAARASILDKHPVTPRLVACLSPYTREHIRRFGQYVLDMNELPEPLEPQPLPFEPALCPLFTRILNLPRSGRHLVHHGHAVRSRHLQQHTPFHHVPRPRSSENHTHPQV